MNDVDFEKKEEANLGFDKVSFKSITKIIIYIIIIVLAFILISGIFIYFFSENFKFTKNISLDDDIDLNQETNISVEINLTNEEYIELTRKLSIVGKVLRNRGTSDLFTPLFRKTDDPQDSSSYVPINKVSFMISSSPKTIYLCKLYLDIWSTEYGSKIIKSTGIHPFKKVYWSYSDIHNSNKPADIKLNSTDYITSKSLNISLINQTSHHKKWFFMIKENFKTVPKDVEWFIILDDDTLPFIDRILSTLSKYDNPSNNSYFFHSPGERTSGLHLGNGGSGFIISRKLATMIIPELEDCNKYIQRRFYNGDIRLDHCIRYKTGTMPILDYGMFQMDLKGFSGDMTGFIEGYADKYILKSLHHLEKSKYLLFPSEFNTMMSQNGFNNVNYHKKMRGDLPLNLDFDTFSEPNYFSQAAHFARSLVISDNLFLKRFIILLKNKNEKYAGILNLGYSFVVFSSPYEKKNNFLKNEILDYLKGVEQTFTANIFVLYENLTRLLVPKNEKLKRFYFKKSIPDLKGKNSYWQEYCSISSPETVVKIHIDDNQKVSLSFFNFTYV